MGRPRQTDDKLPKYVRVRHGSYHYDKPGGLHKKLCRVSAGMAKMYEMLELLVEREVSEGPMRVVQAKPPAPEPGIYLMFQDGVCVYVGKSVNVKRRVSQRHRLVDKVVMIAEADPERRSELEGQLIRLMNPKTNVQRV